MKFTKFNPEEKETLTVREALDPIFDIKYKEDAIQFKAAYTEHIKNLCPEKPNPDAEYIANSNIGYWAGYQSLHERERLENLFEVEHPIFGSIKEMGIPSTGEAFECGMMGIDLATYRTKENLVKYVKNLKKVI